MTFRLYDNLRTFGIVASHSSISAAATDLNLSKGAVSHQIRQLEKELGFDLFHRLPRGVKLTENGKELLSTATLAFNNIEHRIQELRSSEVSIITLGLTTYFASRWLSPRLMSFLQCQPNIRLRLQPMIDLAKPDADGTDFAIRWGDGHWPENDVDCLFPCAAWPCGNSDTFALVQERGVEEAFENLTLLHDSEDSDAWAKWYAIHGIAYQPRPGSLIIPDPNVRVQAVIDGQGIALNDELVAAELSTGALHRLSESELSEYGYFIVYPSQKLTSTSTKIFVDWLKAQLVSIE